MVAIAPELKANISYQTEIDALGIKGASSPLEDSPPPLKETDLLRFPFQKSIFAKNLRWSGGRFAINSISINAQLIGGPRIVNGRRNYRKPDCLTWTHQFNTGSVENITNQFDWCMQKITSGFEFHIFNSIDQLTNVKRVIAGFLPRYHENAGIDQTVWMDRHVEYQGDAWESFMEAIEHNLSCGLPTVLFRDNEAYMLLKFNNKNNDEFNFEGYEMIDTPRNIRPTLVEIQIEKDSFYSPNSLQKEKFHRGAMAFVAFEPLY
jgi:hypothetical protein